jgi:hypothetical protein
MVVDPEVTGLDLAAEVVDSAEEGLATHRHHTTTSHHHRPVSNKDGDLGSGAVWQLEQQQDI